MPPAAPYRPRPPPARSDSPGVPRDNRSRKGTRGERGRLRPPLSPATLICPEHAESIKDLILPFLGRFGAPPAAPGTSEHPEPPQG